MAELKRCPFCGGKAELHNCAELENTSASLIFTGKYGVHCTECHVATLPLDGKDEAVAAWNRRENDG